LFEQGSGVTETNEKDVANVALALACDPACGPDSENVKRPLDAATWIQEYVELELVCSPTIS
jgi:hypothetical protein